MSAGDDVRVVVPVLPAAATVVNDLAFLAPKFAAAVKMAVAECKALGIEALVYETYRTDALAKAYYARGRTTPGRIVTHAKDNVHSWHGFGLGADIIHATLRWDAPADWWPRMAAVFKRNRCNWGGDWRSFKDLPHVQWEHCPDSPDDDDRRLLRESGLLAVWERWGAL